MLDCTPSWPSPACAHVCPLNLPRRRSCVGSVSDVLAQRSAQQQLAGGSLVAAAAEAGEDMCDASLRVTLDVIGIVLFARDFKASGYGDCPVLEVGQAEPGLWPLALGSP
jgi:hypothetical protein